MKNWNITIRASITKTIQAEAETLEEAEQMAHEEFSVLKDTTGEDYEQDTLSSEEAE